MSLSSLHNEQELLHNIARGNEAAFRQLVNTYEPLLLTYIIRHTNDQQLAEEIVQDIFVKIWLTREALDNIRNFSSFLFVIARNYALSVLRKLVRERQLHQEWEMLAAYKLTPEISLKEIELQLSIVDEAIEQLPPQQKKVWILSRRQGMKQREIGAELGLSPETVKKYMKYATASIVQYVKQYSPAHGTGTILLLL